MTLGSESSSSSGGDGDLSAAIWAAVARETTVYLQGHLVLEPWGTPGPLALSSGSPPERRCQECGRLVADDDAFCRACGAPVGAPIVTRS